VFDDTLKLVLSAAGRRPAASLPRRLDGLFRRLAAAPGPREASEIEDLIWGAWMAHDDPGAEEALERATRALGARELDEAEALLDELVAAHPEYAEAWNKRATLRFLQRHDPESVADIGRTLELEPRHFGAMLHFAEIVRSARGPAEAGFAVLTARSIHPHLTIPD
jgi:tetratricopeptide (TPR) repeat protein